MRMPTRFRDILAQNKIHCIRFLYLTMGSVLQLGALNFVVYPYLSRRLALNTFADLLLLMTTMNFYVTILGPPVTMTFYRRFIDMSEEESADYTGALLKIMAGALTLLIFLHLPLYDFLARIWKLSMGKSDFLYALLYMFFLSIDAFLIARTHFEFGFQTGFISRAIFFFGTLLIIPCSLFFPENWMFSFIAAPFMSSVFLTIRLVQEGRLHLAGKLSKVDLPRFGWDYTGFFLAGIGSQLLMYSDRWIVAAYNVPKAQLAYYIIAVQASLLVSFPVDRMSELMMPYIGHLKSMDSLTINQARKSVLSMGIGLVYLGTFGIAIGYLFFKLYQPSFLEYGWRYFIIMLGGVCLFTIYTYSRAYLVLFFPSSYLIGPFLLGTAVQIGTTMLFLSRQHDVIGAAYGRFLGFFIIASLYFFVCQVRIFKIALSPHP